MLSVCDLKCVMGMVAIAEQANNHIICQVSKPTKSIDSDNVSCSASNNNNGCSLFRQNEQQYHLSERENIVSNCWTSIGWMTPGTPEQ